MSRLVEYLYVDLGERAEGLFGLAYVQRRSGLIGSTTLQTSGWYNEKGERLGIGDLDENDLIRISNELEEGETFIVLLYRDASDLEDHLIIESKRSRAGIVPPDYCHHCLLNEKGRHLDHVTPGIRRVAERCTLILKPGIVYAVTSYPDQRFWMNRYQLIEHLEEISRDRAKELLLPAAT